MHFERGENLLQNAMYIKLFI